MFDKDLWAATADQPSTRLPPTGVSDDLTSEFEALFGQQEPVATSADMRTADAQKACVSYPPEELWEMLQLSQETVTARTAKLHTVENLLNVQQDISAGQVQKLADLGKQIMTVQQHIKAVTIDRDKWWTERNKYLAASNRTAEARNEVAVQLSYALTTNKQLQNANEHLQRQLNDQIQQAFSLEREKQALQAELTRTSILKGLWLAIGVSALGAWFESNFVQLFGYLAAVLVTVVYWKSPFNWWEN